MPVPKFLVPDSVADKAGVAAGDMLVAINGTKPISVPEALQALAEVPIGETVTLSLRRAGKERIVKVEAK